MDLKQYDAQAIEMAKELHRQHDEALGITTQRQSRLSWWSIIHGEVIHVLLAEPVIVNEQELAEEDLQYDCQLPECFASFVVVNGVLTECSETESDRRRSLRDAKIREVADDYGFGDLCSFDHHVEFASGGRNSATGNEIVTATRYFLDDPDELVMEITPDGEVKAVSINGASATPDCEKCGRTVEPWNVGCGESKCDKCAAEARVIQQTA